MDSERPTPFEDRLRSITPAAPTDALRGRIAQHVAPRRAVSPWAIGLAGLAAAACIALGVWVALSWPMTGTEPEMVDDVVPAPIVESPTPVPEPDTVEAASAPAGTLLAYHQAMRHSPDAVFATLENQTAPTAHATSRNARPLRAMDAAMFLHEDERCDG